MTRTPSQKTADRFDADLYDLILKAERDAESGERSCRDQWAAAARHLRAARPHVRWMMHPDDRASTS